MIKKIEQSPAEVYISAADLEYANLNEWEDLELHLLNQTAVVIPGQMTAMELIQTAEALQGLAADLLAALGKACELCDSCQSDMLCDLMKGEIRPEVGVPDYVLEEADLDPDYKLTFPALIFGAGKSSQYAHIGPGPKFKINAILRRPLAV